jgi:large subunit ribosomal protein L4
MAELPLLDKNGKSIGNVSVDEKLFGDKVRKRLLHQVVVMYEANRRQGTHCTKTKGEVSGSGKKPYRQKGTGLARAGSLRSPIRKGGSVAMGPRPRDYRLIITRKTRKAALDSALLAKIRDNEISVIEALEIPEAKTRLANDLFKAAGFPRKVLVGYVGRNADTKEANDRAVLACRNLPHISIQPVEEFNAYEILRHKDVLLTKEALDRLVAERKS